MPPASLEYQVFAHARPGTSDTSAIPNDQVNNPGTINSIINFRQRPTFANEVVDKWRKVDACDAGDPETSCWCEPGRVGKCWRKSVAQETVHHILKGRSEEHTSELQSLMRISYAVFCVKKKINIKEITKRYSSY